jgi:glutaredoxin 3
MARPKIEMYANSWCPYCEYARTLLRRKGADFEEISLEAEPERRAEMIHRSGRHTVPQIFIGARHVGGSDEIYALDDAGELDALLAGTEPEAQGSTRR